MGDDLTDIEKEIIALNDRANKAIVEHEKARRAKGAVKDDFSPSKKAEGDDKSPLPGSA